MSIWFYKTRARKWEQFSDLSYTSIIGDCTNWSKWEAIGSFDYMSIPCFGYKCQLYSIGLAGEENRKCRVSRAFDYMSIWFYKICERKWEKLHDTTWHSKTLSLHFVLSCLPPLRKRSMQVSCKHPQTQQKVTAVLLALCHWTWLEGLSGRVCCCDSGKKQQKNRSRTGMGAPSVSSCTTYSNKGAGASRHRTDFAYKTCQPQLTLRMKPWHTKWESNKGNHKQLSGRLLLLLIPLQKPRSHGDK